MGDGRWGAGGVGTRFEDADYWVVMNELMPAGERVVGYDVSEFPPGVYILRLAANGHLQTLNGKLVVTR